MPDLLLKRHVTEHAIFGFLIGEGNVPFAVTLELPWKENQSRISSIPMGVYKCKRVQSPKFGNTFEITGVEGRSHILFHGGNAVADTLGCVLIGHGFDLVKGKPGIVQSQKEFGEFLKIQHGVNEFTLHVINT